MSDIPYHMNSTRLEFAARGFHSVAQYDRWLRKMGGHRWKFDKFLDLDLQ